MKIESRGAYRAAIQHALEHAEMHARMLEDGHVADGDKPAHHAMAMRALDEADSLHGIARSALYGVHGSQEVVVDGGHSEGDLEFVAPRMADGELKTRFAEVITKVGKLPRSLRSIVSTELGTVDGEIVEEKLMGFKADREALTSLRRSASESQERLDQAEREHAIENALDKRLLSPADAKKLRGLDPSTGAVVGKPWSRARVERYIAERAAEGPIAEIARPGVERTVSAPVPAAAPSLSRPAIRFGNVETTSSPAQVQSLAQSLAAHFGYDPAAILAKGNAATVNASDRAEGIATSTPRR